MPSLSPNIILMAFTKIHKAQLSVSLARYRSSMLHVYNITKLIKRIHRAYRRSHEFARIIRSGKYENPFPANVERRFLSRVILSRRLKRRGFRVLTSPCFPSLPEATCSEATKLLDGDPTEWSELDTSETRRRRPREDIFTPNQIFLFRAASRINSR